MPPLVEAVPDEIVVREGEDVGGKPRHARTPPGALPLGWRTRRRYEDGDTPSAFAPARTGSFWLTTIRSCRSSTLRRGRPSFTIIAAIAQLERSLIVERVKAGLRRARARHFRHVE